MEGENQALRAEVAINEGMKQELQRQCNSLEGELRAQKLGAQELHLLLSLKEAEHEDEKILLDNCREELSALEQRQVSFRLYYVNRSL